MFDTSDILDDLHECLDFEELDEIYAIYGDPAYREDQCVIKPFRTGPQMTREEKKVNEALAAKRIVVEWEFGHVAKLFSFVRHKPEQKTLLNRCGLFYLVATLMKNVHICVNGGNQTSTYFGLEPPTLEEYINEIKPQ